MLWYPILARSDLVVERFFEAKRGDIGSYRRYFLLTVVSCLVGRANLKILLAI